MHPSRPPELLQAHNLVHVAACFVLSMHACVCCLMQLAMQRAAENVQNATEPGTNHVPRGGAQEVGAPV